MSPDTEETAVKEAVLEQLNKEDLPRLLELQERVGNGEAINDHDLQLLERVMQEIHALQSLAQNNPELEKLFAQITALYTDTTARAVDNEDEP